MVMMVLPTLMTTLRTAMDTTSEHLIKLREIQFCKLRPDNQAAAASELLSGIDGVISTQPQAPHLLLVRYDVRQLTLAVIDAALTDLGYHLSSNLLAKLKRSLYYYTEETERQNLGLDGSCMSCSQVFVNRYQRLRHGCRDERPEHWRHYQ